MDYLASQNYRSRLALTLMARYPATGFAAVMSKLPMEHVLISLRGLNRLGHRTLSGLAFASALSFSIRSEHNS